MALIRTSGASTPTIQHILPVTASTQFPSTTNAQAIVFGYNATPTLTLNGTALTPSDTNSESGYNINIYNIPTLSPSDRLESQGRCVLFYI